MKLVSQRIKNIAMLAGIFVLMAGNVSWEDGGKPTFVEGKNIFIETGVEAPDRSPTWYAPMVAKPYAPVFQMLATRGTQGAITRRLIRLP